MPRTIAVASGKGGVGKTSFSLNLSVSLARLGNRVCLVDADLGLANLDVLLNLSPQNTLDDIIFNHTPLQETLISIERNLDILPGGSGISRLANLPFEKRDSLFNRLSELQEYDYIIIDNSPGINPGVISFCLAAWELILVISPERTSITDGYGLLKTLRENGLSLPPFLVINKINNEREAEKILQKFNAASKKFLALSLLFLGIIPRDSSFRAELENNSPLVDLYPNSPTAQCVVNIANRLHSRPRKEEFHNSIQEFWESTLQQFYEQIDPEYQNNGSGESGKNSQELVPQSGSIESQIQEMKKTIHALLSMSNSEVSSYMQKISPLDNLYRDISLLLKKMEKRIPPDASACNSNIGIVCHDEDMKVLIYDMLISNYFNPLDLVKNPGKIKQSDLIICNLERFLDKENKLRFLHSANKIPVIFLLGIYYYNNPPAFLQKREGTRIVPVPFNLGTLLNAIDELIGNRIN